LKSLGKIDLRSLALFTVVLIVICIFLVYPVLIVFVDSVIIQGRLDLSYLLSFFADAYYMKCFWNSIILSLVCVATSSLVGVPLAYFLSRYRLPGKTLLTTISLMPMIVPPFVGAMAFIFLFGRYGTLNLILMDWLRVTNEPINLIYGLHGLVFLETLHLYPLICLNCSAAITQIDPALEESAEIEGASGIRRFFTISLPLATPGFAAGAFLVFIWTFSDWVTPTIVGLNDYLAAQAYADLIQLIDVPRFQKGLVACVIVALFSIVVLVAMRRYVSLKQYVSLTKGVTMEGRVVDIGTRKRIAAMVFCLAFAGISLLGPVWLVFSAFAKTWKLTPFPTEYTLSNFAFIMSETPLFIANTFKFAGVAVLLDLLLGLAVAYLLARVRPPGENLLDGLITMILAVPGIVVGVGYLRGFHRLELPLIGDTLTHLWIIMPLVIAIRRVPYVVRSSYASLQQMDIAFEEASDILGASRLQTFLRITAPLIVRGVFAGTVFSFIQGIQEVSSTMFLVLPGWETMTIGTFIFFQSSGLFGAAAAIGVVLMAVTALSMLISAKLGGRMLGGAFNV